MLKRATIPEQKCIEKIFENNREALKHSITIET